MSVDFDIWWTPYFCCTTIFHGLWCHGRIWGFAWGLFLDFCAFFSLCLTLWAILTPRWLLEFSAPYLSFGNWSQQSRKRVHRVESANSELLMIYDAIMERFEILLPSTPWHCYSHSCLRVISWFRASFFFLVLDIVSNLLALGLQCFHTLFFVQLR